MEQNIEASKDQVTPKNSLANKKFIVIAILCFQLIFLAGVLLAVFFAYTNWTKRALEKINMTKGDPAFFDSPQENSPIQNDATVQITNIKIPIVENAPNKLVFSQLVDSEAYNNIELFVVDANGDGLQKLTIKGAGIPFKHLGNSEIFYKKDGFDDSFFIGDLSTGTETRITPINDLHPDARAIVTLEGLSPDTRYVLYGVSIAPKDCLLFEARAACDESEYKKVGADKLDGVYLYDTQEKNSFLFAKSLVRSSRWDMKNGYFYYLNMDYSNGGLEKINLKTKIVTRIKNATSFGYMEYPLFTKDASVIIDAETGDAGTISSSIVYISYAKTGEKRELDWGKWADLQPFITISPDEETFVFQRERRDGNGYTMGVLEKFEFGQASLGKSSKNVFYRKGKRSRGQANHRAARIPRK